MPRLRSPSPLGWLGCKATRDQIDRVDGIASRAGLTRSELIRLALERFESEGLPRALVESAADRRSARLHAGSPSGGPDGRPAA